MVLCLSPEIIGSQLSLVDGNTLGHDREREHDAVASVRLCDEGGVNGEVTSRQIWKDDSFWERKSNQSLLSLLSRVLLLLSRWARMTLNVTSRHS